MGQRLSNLIMLKALAAFGLALAPAAAKGQTFPSASDVARPGEEAVAEDLTRLVLSPPNTAVARLRRLGSLLARLHRPTPLRGLVQLYRAGTALDADRRDIAWEAVEESVRLLPGHSAPLLLAFREAAYSDRPQQAVDYLLRASEIDADAVRRIDEYDLNSLLSRLTSAEHRRLRSRLAERLFAIGWLGEDLSLRSRLARLAIEARVEAGDISGAEALLPRLVDPRDVRRLLMQNLFRPIWPRLEQWAGPSQRNLWPNLLAEQRERWHTSRDPIQGSRYATALDDAQHLQTLVRELLPLFSRRIEPREDYDLLWLASPLATALARLDRWEEVEQIYGRALAVWPLTSHANALNLVANRGRHRLMRGDAAAALADLDLAIQHARRSEGEVSAGVLALMHYFRACALHELARDSDAVPSVGYVLQHAASPDVLAGMYLCLEQPETARDALIGALEVEDQRAAVIAFVQPDASTPMQSDYARALDGRVAALRRDPVLLAAVSRYGRVLPDPMQAGAPPEQTHR